MATISDLIGLLSPILGLHASTLVRHASQLRVANLLPGEDENLSALEAATFLVAATGARAPTEAIEAARAFGALPGVRVDVMREDSATGFISGTSRAIDDLPPPSDEHALLWESVRRSFVAALEAFIHQAEDPARKLEELPRAIGILRDLRNPYALLAYGRTETGGVWGEIRLIFAPAPAASSAPAELANATGRLQVWCWLPDIVIPLLGDLLAGRIDAHAASRVAEELQAGEQ